MQKIYLIVIALLFVGGVVYMALTRGHEQRSIEVVSPMPDSIVVSPLSFFGQARGNWFFEGSFPAHVEDGKGNVFGGGTAKANGEWATDALVSFSGTIVFSAPDMERGVLVFEKDNPSGLPENAARFEVPIRFR